MKKLGRMSIVVFMLFASLPITNVQAVAKSVAVSTYDQLHDAIYNGDTNITLNANIDAATLSNEAEEKALKVSGGKTTTIDLNAKTVTSPADGKNYYRHFLVADSTLSLKNGNLIVGGTGTNSSNGTGAYGSIFAENAELNLENLYLKNTRPWGLNVKTANSKSILKNVSIDSTYGGGIEISGGSASVYGGTFTQKGYFDHCSTNVSVSGGGELNVYSGTFTSENFGAYVFNSGGTINIQGGDFTATKAVLKVDKSVTNNPSIVNISGGTFNGPLQIADGVEFKITAGLFSNTGLAKDKFLSYVDSASKVVEMDNALLVYPKVTKVTLSATDLKVEKNTSTQLTATLAPVGSLESVAWTSSDESVATVDKTGKVKGLKAGTAIIRATAENVSTTCYVTVFEIKPPTSNDDVVLGEGSASIVKGVVKDVIENIDKQNVISEDTKVKLEKALEEGKVISVLPKIEKQEESAITKENITKVENVMKETTAHNNVSKIAQFHDLSMVLTADENPLGVIHELSNKIKITIAIPDDLIKDGRKFYMIRVHDDDKAERIDGELIDNNFTFETDKFSLYALAYEEAKVEDPILPENPTGPNTPNITNKPTAPSTGDTNDLNELFALIAGSAMIIGFSVLRRRKICKRL